MRARDVPGDPGLARTALANERGPYVGQPQRRPIRRFATDRRLERVLQELYRGFGPQRWWPAATRFEVLVGAVLTQNTSWANVERALANLRRARRVSPARLLNAGRAELEALLRPSGYFRAKTRTLLGVAEWYLAAGGLDGLRGRRLRALRAELLALHGVGPETADSILCFGLSRRAAIVDTYTRRVVGRHGLTDPEQPYEDLRAWLEARLVPSQAVFEEFHALFVRVGYGHCKPSPRCASCPATTPAGPV